MGRARAVRWKTRNLTSAAWNLNSLGVSRECPVCTALWAEGHAALESKGEKYKRWTAAKECTAGSKETLASENRTPPQGQAKGTQGGD